jgi:hypothetical protein
MGEIPMSDGIVGVERLSHEGERVLEAPFVKPLQPEHAQPDEARSGLGLCLGERGVPLREAPHACASDIERGPLAVDRRELQRHVADLVGG